LEGVLKEGGGDAQEGFGGGGICRTPKKLVDVGNDQGKKSKKGKGKDWGVSPLESKEKKSSDYEQDSA